VIGGKMKYKIIPEDIVKNMIEFLDEIQFEAAKTQDKESLHKINFCNWMINELLNGADGFDTEEERDKEMKKSWDDYYDYMIDYELPEDMSDEEFQILLDHFDGFMKGWDKAYKKSNYKEKGKKKTNSLKKFKKELKKDKDLTADEKFELYYDEYIKRNNEKESLSLNQLLKNAGVRKSHGGSDTH